MPFSLATYNILAQAYITPERYPRTPATVLASVWRRPALIRHIVALNTDVVCLQEVEDETFAAVQQVLEPNGYIGHFAKKEGGNGLPQFERNLRARRNLHASGAGVIARGECRSRVLFALRSGWLLGEGGERGERESEREYVTPACACGAPAYRTPPWAR